MAKTDATEKKATKNTANGKKASQDKQENAPAQVSKKKQHKEQAKQEAKLMLKLEQAKQGVQKAQQKLARAQKDHADTLAHQHELEERLNKLRHPEPASSHNGTAAEASSTETQEPAVLLEETLLALETPFITQSIDVTDAPLATTTSTGEMENTATGQDQPLAEGRNDIPDDSQIQTTLAGQQEFSSTSQITGIEKDIHIESDGASMPLLTDDEHTLPPPATREEVAEAALVETSSTTQEEDTSTANNGEGEVATENLPTKNTSHRRTRRTN